jgi:hypothetical protein
VRDFEPVCETVALGVNELEGLEPKLGVRENDTEGVFVTDIVLVGETVRDGDTEVVLDGETVPEGDNDCVVAEPSIASR